MLSHAFTFARCTFTALRHAERTRTRSNSSLAAESLASGALAPHLFRPTAQVVELGGGSLAAIDGAIEALTPPASPHSILIANPRITLELTHTPWLAGGRRFDLLASDQHKGFTREELLKLIAGVYEGEWALARKWKEVDELERAKGQSQKKGRILLPDVSMSTFECLRLDSSAEYDPETKVLRPRVVSEVE